MNALTMVCYLPLPSTMSHVFGHIKTELGQEHSSEAMDENTDSEVCLPESTDIENNKVNFKFSDLPENGVQAKYFLKLVKLATKLNDAEVIKKNELLKTKIVCIIHLGEKDSLNLLSFFADAFRLRL